MAKCSIARCSKAARSRGWCPAHYQRWRHGQDPNIPTVKELPVEERFWPKVNKSGPIPEGQTDLGPCWVWTGALTGSNYGAFTDRAISTARRGFVLAHRWSYQAAHGPIPDGLHLDHLCRNPPCVNPAHLEPVTVAENLLRSDIAPSTINGAKTHCPQGHPYSPENTRITPQPGRECKECRRETTRRFRARKAQAAAATSP